MHTNEDKQVHDIILTDGPPWGFTLAGGSEFGSPLCVKKVTNDNNTSSSQLRSGDEILSVNGVCCTSRANAIQMVRSIENELQLKICRWSNSVYDNHDLNNSQYSHQTQTIYTNMVENMDDLSHSTYSLKRDSMLNKPLNDSNGNYRILSINKNGTSNEHNIRIGIPCNDQEKQFPFSPERITDDTHHRKISSSQLYNTQPQKQKVTVKMVPAFQPVSRKLSGGGTTYSASSSRLIDPNQIDTVEEESVKTVSAAKAMFENLSTSSNFSQQALSTSKTQMKSWNSGSAIEQRANADHVQRAQLNTPSPPPQHQHSRSLPIEMAGKEFQKAVDVYKQYRNMGKSTDSATERPKSAHYYKDKVSEPPVIPQRYSQSEYLKPLRNNRPVSSLPFERLLSSSSSEELRDVHRPKSVHVKNDSANELRQAANRYHQELMKNYPKFRHSIANADSAAKFSRKVSSPTHDAFSRGEPYRATIATTTSTRMLRSKSASDTLEDSCVQELLSKSNDNSMMSRLLRDQNLMKVDEVQETQDNIVQKQYSPSPSNRQSPSNGRSAGETLEQEAKSPTQYLSNSELNETENDMCRLNLTPNELNKAPNSTVKNVVVLTRVRKSSAQIHATSRDSWSHSDVVETDIDSEEAERIIHRKDPSTDSAVYMMNENPEIMHAKTLSNGSMDSINELSQINHKSTEETEIDGCDPSEYLPPPPDEFLLDDEQNVEKEKPQRTINRRKKDCQAVNSRNNSCVSTDSTTSTTTVDSGIVMRSESSPRTSPLSSESYYSGSRETLDDDVDNLNSESRVASTPERHRQAKEVGYQLMRQKLVDDETNEKYVSNDTDNTSATHSRQQSDDIASPSRADDLDGEKTKLMESMREKINELREQEQEISDEIKMNEELGKKVLHMAEAKATQSEFSKYELFIGELNKIIALLLSLTQRLHRYELMLQDLDMSNETDKIKKDTLVAKIDKLKSQHEEACYLRDVNDKRGDNVANVLEKYCTEEEFADFQYYVDMKSQLALMQSEIREKVKLGEERLKALQQTGSEWGFS